MNRALMIEVDGRRFFTAEKNFDQLIEFANVFDAQISVVQAAEIPTLDLIALAAAISNPEYALEPQVEVVEVKIKGSGTGAKRAKRAAEKPKATNHSQMIDDFIIAQFQTGKPVSLAVIADKFQNYKFGMSCYRSHLLRVRKELEGKKHVIEKKGVGEYVLVK